MTRRQLKLCIMSDFNTQQDTPTDHSDFDPFFSSDGGNQSRKQGWYHSSAGFIPYDLADNGGATGDDDFSKHQQLVPGYDGSQRMGYRDYTQPLRNNGDMSNTFAQPYSLQMGGNVLQAGEQSKVGTGDYSRNGTQPAGNNAAPPAFRNTPVGLNSNNYNTHPVTIGNPSQNPGPQGGPGSFNGHPGTYGPKGNTPEKTAIADLVGGSVVLAATALNPFARLVAGGGAKYGMNALLQNGQTFTGAPRPLPVIPGYHGPPSGRGR